MNKIKFTFLLISTICNNLISQDNYWIELEKPRADILGIGVKDVLKNDINDEPGIELDNPEIKTYKSTTYLKDYQEKYKGFFTSFFSKEKFLIKTIEIKELKVRSLSPSSIIRLKPEYKYVYQGLSADTIIINISRKKESNFDYSKAINTIFSSASSTFLNANSTNIVKEWLPILDSIKSESKDSIFYTFKIYSPDVFFKIKVISYSKLQKHNWDEYLKYLFPNPNKCKSSFIPIARSYIPNKTTILKNNSKEKFSLSQTPEFWGGTPNSDVKIKIGVETINNEVILFAYVSENKIRRGVRNEPTWTKIELPFEIDDNGIKFWNFENEYIYSFYYNKIEKQILLSVNATQKDSKTIEITNWEGEMCKGTDKTYIKYPEFEVVYYK